MKKEYISKRAAEMCMDAVIDMTESMINELKEVKLLLMMAQTVEIEYEDKDEADNSNS